MPGLNVSLFGSFRIFHEGRSAPHGVSPPAQPLLAYLLLRPDRVHRREVLAGTFWGDVPEHRARSSLSTALWRLRKVLEPEGVPKGTYLITNSIGEVGFNGSSNYRLDVADFENGIKGVIDKPDCKLTVEELEHVQSALRLYEGELLEGLYDDWILRERERLRCLYIEGLTFLMYNFHCQGSYQPGLACGQKILAEDPLRETVHRELMRIYLLDGQRGAAIRQYETCARTLMDELGILPLEETQNLYASIVSSGEGLSLARATETVDTHLRAAIEDLDQATRDMTRAQARLRLAFRSLKHTNFRPR